MNTDIVIGLFALYVALVSLVLVLTGQQETLLALLRRVWGRTLGHSLYFLARVALPMLVCTLCLGWGVRHYDPSQATRFDHPHLQLNLQDYRDLVKSWQNKVTNDSYEEVYGA